LNSSNRELFQRLGKTLSDAPQEAQFFTEQAMAEPLTFDVAGGVAGVFSTRSPAKETPNEDAAAIIPAGPDAVVLAVADGLGGNADGERASRVALQELRAAVEAGAAAGGEGDRSIFRNDASSASFAFLRKMNLSPSSRASEHPALANPSALLRASILDGLDRANRAVLALGTGAATTMAVVEIAGRTIRPYHVGDSLILLVGGHGKVKMQTISHSPVGYGVEAGLLDDVEAMHHADRHIVSNVVGCADMRIEIGPARQLAPRDTILIASDGLSDNLRVEEIIDRVRKGRLAASLLTLADEAALRMRSPAEGQPSKPDDLTVVMFRPTSNASR
jgi:PPM family protein phosphatase